VIAMRRWSVLLTLAAASCVSAPPVANNATPTVVASTRAPVSLIATPAPLEPTRTPITLWRDIEGVAASARYLAWHGLKDGDPQRDSQQLMAMDRQTSRTITIATAPRPAGLIAWLRVSDTWVVWADYTDRLQISDWRVRAARLPDGAPITLLEAPTNARLEDRPEFDLRGDEIVVAGRFAGASAHQVIRIGLVSGRREVLLEAKAPETLSWPAFEGDVVFVESRVAGSTRLLSVGRDGSPRSAPPPPASEPTFSGGWLAYKASERGDLGPIVFRSITTEETLRSSDKGEAPASSDGVFTWVSAATPRVRVYDSLSHRSFGWDVPRELALSSAATAGRVVAVITQRLEAPTSFSIVLLEVP
jgi:hypothetical protein